MEFLGVGYQGILLVFILLLVVVGPERMPGVAYQIGRAVRTMQKYARAVRDEFSEELGYIEEEYKGLRDEVQATGKSLREEQEKLQEEWKASKAGLESDVNTPITETGGTAASQVNGHASASQTPQQIAGPADSGEEATPELAEVTAAEPKGFDGPPLVF